MGALLGLASAFAFGVSDFVGGLAARRIHFLLVTLIGQAIGVMAVWTSLIWLHGSGPDRSAVLWGAVSGMGSTVGTLALYRGYAHGQMAVTGPLSAVGAAVVPALVGVVVLGDDLPPLGVAGVVLAVPSIWLMAAERSERPSRVRAGVVEGMVSGAGFGLLFIALGLAGGGAGLWPVAAGQATAAGTLLAATAATRMPIRSVSAPAVRLSVSAGALGIAATMLYFAAAHTSLLTVAAVLTSVYPGVTVALAAALLHERPAVAQWIGLAMGAVAVTAIVVS